MKRTHPSFASRTVSITEFKRHPLSAFREIENGILLVMAYNQPAYYVVTPERMAELMAGASTGGVRGDHDTNEEED